MLKTSMASPLWVLSGFPVAGTTRVEDVDGRPQGVLAAGPAAATTDVEDVDGRPPVGAVGIFGSNHHRS
jgi:hypothetical protein